MRFTLRDWDRLWYLCCADGAGEIPDALEAGPARDLLSELLRDDGNLQAIRGMLQAEYPLSARPIPNQPRALLSEIGDRLGRRRWALTPGPEIDLQAGLTRSTRRGAGRTQTLRVFDFNTDDYVEAPRNPLVPESIPAIRFSGGQERSEWLVFRYGSEREPGIVLSHGNESEPVPDFALATEGGPELAFAHTAEPPQGFGFSATVRAPA